MEKGVRVKASPESTKKLHEILGRLPEAHLQVSGVKSIMIESRRIVTERFSSMAPGVLKSNETIGGYWDGAKGLLVTTPETGAILHEFGHSLQAKYGMVVDDIWNNGGKFGFVSSYGSTNRRESFADAYMLWASGKGAKFERSAGRYAARQQIGVALRGMFR